MPDSTRFEGEIGQNIQLSEDRKQAKWLLNKSGGWTYSACALKPGQSVQLTLEGSGHCDVGFIKEDPSAQSRRIKELKMTKLNYIRLHKRTCKITLTSKENGKEVYTDFEGERVTKKTDKVPQVWIAADIRFGNVTIKMHPNGTCEEKPKFSENHGPNIKLDASNKKSSTVSSNPGSLCLIHLKVGETITLKCSPITDGSRDPSRYHVTLHATDSSPDELERTFPWIFDPNTNPGQASPLTTLELLEKGHCKGNISISLCKSNIIEYTTASSKKNTQIVQFVTSYGVFVVVELFRVCMTILETKNTDSGSKQGNLGQNVVDSRRREPMNEYAENSMCMDVDGLPARDQDYVSVTQVKEVGNDNNNNTSKFINRSQASGTNTNDSVNGLTKRLDKVEANQAEIIRIMHDNKSHPACSTCFHGPDVPGEELDIELLKPNWPNLIRTMRADRLCDHLFAKCVISENDMNVVVGLSKTNPADANRTLLQMMSTKRVKRSLMTDILESAEETHLIPMMFPK